MKRSMKYVTLGSMMLVFTASSAYAGCHNETTEGSAYCADSQRLVSEAKVNHSWDALQKKYVGNAPAVAAIKRARASAERYKKGYCKMLGTTGQLNDRFGQAAAECETDLNTRVLGDLSAQLNCEFGVGYGVVSNETFECAQDAHKEAAETLKKLYEGLPSGGGTNDDIKARDAYLKTIQ
jgi:hypothetical protein